MLHCYLEVSFDGFLAHSNCYKHLGYLLITPTKHYLYKTQFNYPGTSPYLQGCNPFMGHPCRGHFRMSSQCTSVLLLNISSSSPFVANTTRSAQHHTQTSVSRVDDSEPRRLFHSSRGYWISGPTAITITDNNTNTRMDNLYGAVIMIKALQQFTRFM